MLPRSTGLKSFQTFAAVISAIDAAYTVARNSNERFSKGRARLFLVCHQAFYSAASSLARGVPLDAAAASRRALEAARTALAIKINPQNADKWIAYEERLDRWKARQADQKPPKLDVKYEALKGDPLAEKLARSIGNLSDAAVHFTPEFLSSLIFKERNHGNELFSVEAVGHIRKAARLLFDNYPVRLRPELEELLGSPSFSIGPPSNI